MKQIAVTQRVELVKSTGERRDALSQEWATLSYACGFVPVILPNHPEIVKSILSEQRIDGVLLTGGNDLVEYGGDAPERDQTERALIEYAIKENLPLLGVCRGMQMLLDHFCTTLEPVEGHVRTEHILSDGRRVNSYHNWGAKICRPPLIATVFSEDGVVEAVCHEDCANIYGIMWHPERYKPFREADIAWIRRVFLL